MVSKQQYENAVEKSLEYFNKASIALTEAEKQNVEIADFGLNDLDNTGLQLITYINTERVCAKELVLFPHQTCPEHIHPNRTGSLGKEETFRCRFGKVHLYVEGEKAANPVCKVPAGSEPYYTVFHEITLNPGEQYTLVPNTLHWFQAGDEGAVVSEFSSNSDDSLDVFTDVRIVRAPMVDE
jgi:D-lyxose ketol-isomerase